MSVEISSLFYNFSIPKVFNFEEVDNRILPASGSLISVRYFERIPGRLTVFRLNSCYGLCVGSKRLGLSSSFSIRNSFKRNSIEIKFLFYSPLLARIAFFDAKRKRYKKSKLYYLRLKKIAKSRFRFE